ncbi:MAG: hypothetical protein AB8C13_06660 [Phycisphaerales bacterium]
MKRSKLIEQVNRILTEEWDPIGFVDMGAGEHAYTEYTSYAKGVVALLRTDADVHKIAQYLTMVRTKSIELGANNEADQLIAQRLRNLID